MAGMSAYEFTRFESDFTARERVKHYDARTVAFLIEYNSKAHNLREDKEYKDAKNVFIELTMSCNLNEAINWMRYWIANAMAYGNQTRNMDWRHKFLAAYDLLNHLYKEARPSTGVRWNRDITG